MNVFVKTSYPWLSQCSEHRTKVHGTSTGPLFAIRAVYKRTGAISVLHFPVYKTIMGEYMMVANLYDNLIKA